MFNSVIASVALSTLLARSVIAMPFAELTSILPRNIAHIALDERTNEYVAFKRDGSFYGRFLAATEGSSYHQRRSASSCTDLTVDEAKTLPGWDTITQYADDNWGTGSRNIVTNPSDYLDRPAEACITDSIVEASFNGDPDCQTNTVTTGGTLVGTNGTAIIAVDQGYTSKSTWTVSTATSIGVSETFTVKVGFPDVADVSEAITVSTEVTNTQTQSFETDYNDVTTVTLRMSAPKGETCTAVTSTTTCTLQATAKIQYIATGWIWFNYDSKTHSHYKWAVNMDAVLTNDDDRSSYSEARGSVNANTQSAYDGSCN